MTKEPAGEILVGEQYGIWTRWGWGCTSCPAQANHVFYRISGKIADDTMAGMIGICGETLMLIVCFTYHEENLSRYLK